MIDSLNVEERIKGMVGIDCAACLDSGFVQTWDETHNCWVMMYDEDPIRDENSKTVRRMKVCNHGKMENLGY